MTSIAPRRGPGVAAWLLMILILLALGAAAAIWGLSRWEGAARFFGVTPAATVATTAAPQAALARPVQPAATSVSAPPASTANPAEVAVLEARIARLENTTQQVAGSAGRADGLLVSFAARRAIDRGVPLGYLEALLSERFGASNRQAVATVITAGRNPVRLDQLQTQFEALGPQLQGGGEVGFWEATRQQLGSLISIHRADRPSARPSATYARALARLEAGQVDQALAEARRLPGIGGAGPWVDQARRYIAAHRALDEIESAALLSR
ncbi:hypothetical protein M8312_10600 [Sphingomonas sp. KRR8]|uniref:hypothetical protein n=1 Tax=Sphingomonas sp. KRR8 TaxID=2942996 RepID=UPI0020220259|nr:hypothetical protein [Sphingomonas sp. KRR8]URD60231.1 hypothetical protein M8312_10600 [Sphingomonas sp. KRR8]